MFLKLTSFRQKTFRRDKCTLKIECELFPWSLVHRRATSLGSLEMCFLCLRTRGCVLIFDYNWLFFKNMGQIVWLLMISGKHMQASSHSMQNLKTRWTVSRNKILVQNSLVLIDNCKQISHEIWPIFLKTAICCGE